MAMFREHVAVGAIISMAVVVGVYFYALLTDPLLLLFLFGVTVIGSFLPDVDSDSGMPFYLVYGTASLAATGVVLLYTLSSPYAEDWRYLVGIPAGALFAFWVILGGVFKKCTHHRGIFHSLPALAIAGVGTLLIARHYELSEMASMIFGGAMAVGYLCHLVLDEIHAGITLDGIPFNPKSSFGSALKLFSDSSFVNAATYLLLAVLVFLALKAPIAEAYFYNDSVIIEIGTGTPTILEPGSGGSGGEGSGDGETSGAGGTGGGGEGSSGGGSSSGGTSGGSGGSGSISGGSSGAGSSSGTSGGSGADGSAGSGGSGGNSTGEETEDDALDFLIEEEIVVGAGLGGGGGENGTGSGGGVGTSGGVSVSGGKIRQVLRNSYNLKEILFGWNSSKSTGDKERDRGLMAASTAVRDSNVDSVALSSTAFSLTYRSRGYLLSVIPVSFPVHVAVVPAALSASERVTVQLPWYRFFVRKFFTKEGLVNDVDAVIQTELQVESEADVSSRLLEAVTDFLRRKIGTISDVQAQ